MGFLSPLFLFGLLAIGVPILIHLYRREKSQLVAFPSLMFLRRIPYRSVRQQRIRHWFLLMIRCAAIALVAVAFSRPLLHSVAGGAVAGERSREVVLLVDRSFSMAHGLRWQRTHEAIQSVLDGLTDEDRVTLIGFDERAAVLYGPSRDAAGWRQAVERLKVTSGVTRLAPALKLARRVLLDSDLPDREVVLISDLQRSGWAPGEDVRLPIGTLLSLVDVSGGEEPNLAVTSVILDRDRSGGRRRVGVAARLTGRGSSGFDSVPVTLEIDGRGVQSEEVTVPANGSVNVRFEPLTLAMGQLARGTVRAGGDELEADNAFHFVLSPAHGIGVMALYADSRRRSTLYLQQALDLAKQPFFRVATQRASRLGSSQLTGQSVVVINDAIDDVSAESAEALEELVRDGGGLLVALGSQYRASDSAVAKWLELPPRKTVNRLSDWGGSLAFVDYAHPVFEIFAGPRSGDLSTAKFFRYQELRPREGDRVLARFDDGNVALLERALGSGRVLIWSSSLDTLWNNLALQPVYLPAMHQWMQYLGGFTTAREYYTVGQVAQLDLQPPAGVSEEDSHWLVLSPSGKQETLDREAATDGVAGLLALEEQGFYEVRPVGAPAGGEGVPEGLINLAVNVDFRESDLSTLDQEEFAAAVRPTGEQNLRSDAGEATPLERESAQRLWWYLILTALLILAGESVVANRLSRQRASP